MAVDFSPLSFCIDITNNHATIIIKFFYQTTAMRPQITPFSLNYRVTSLLQKCEVRLQIANNLNQFNIFSLNLDCDMSSPQVQQPPKKLITSETLFKTINIILLSLLAFCVKGFWQFRNICIEKGIYVFQFKSLIWCLIGFIGRYIVKYSYLKISHNTMSKMLKEKEETADQREYRLKSLKKLSFDFWFYVGITAWAYYLFREEYWFPQVAGGNGQCKAIYREYPNWPSNPIVSKNMQIYFMIQLGIHLFSLFQLAFIIGKSYRKYHQFLLHHCVTIILIIFSMMSNQITAGVIIIIVHDASDIFSSGGRGYVETKYSNTFLMVFFFVTMLFSWVYFRAIVYPACILTEVWAHSPLPTDIWHVINFQYKSLLSMACVLVGMHLFWIYFILEFAYKKVKKGSMENTHEAATPAKKGT